MCPFLIYIVTDTICINKALHPLSRVSKNTRPRGDIGRKKIMAIYDNDPVRLQSLSRTYAIIIPYVRNNDPVRTQCIPYVRNNDPVRTQCIPYVRNNDPVRTQSSSRTYAIIIS